MVKKKKNSMSNYITGSIMAGTVAGTLAQSTGSTVGSTMTANMMTGAARPVTPVIKVKGTTMVMGSFGNLKKKGKELFKGEYSL